MRRPGRLTAAFVRNVKEPGRYGHGRGGFGLSLLVKPAARGLSKSWSQRVRFGGAVTNRGLGSYPQVGLAAAREAALQNYLALRQGRIPSGWREARAASMTFREATGKAIQLRAGLWRPGSKTENQWRKSFEQYVFPEIGDMGVAQITARELLAVLAPVTVQKPSTAKKLRQWIKTVFDWAVAQGIRESNPAGAALTAALPRNGNVVNHHKALPHGEVAGALRKVRASRAWAGTQAAFEFLVLTACRSGEVRLARWDEVDMAARVWTVPASRMKAKREHRVPLSDPAVEVLAAAREIDDGSGLIFPSPFGRALGDLSLSKLLRTRGIAAVPHGFRSSFRDWAAETGVPGEVAEAALAHVVGGVEGAYFRSDLFERRRALMQAWADYLSA